MCELANTHIHKRVTQGVVYIAEFQRFKQPPCGVLAFCPSTNVKCPGVKGGMSGSGKHWHVYCPEPFPPLGEWPQGREAAPLWKNARPRNAM